MNILNKKTKKEYEKMDIEILKSDVNNLYNETFTNSEVIKNILDLIAEDIEEIIKEKEGKK